MLELLSFLITVGISGTIAIYIAEQLEDRYIEGGSARWALKFTIFFIASGSFLHKLVDGFLGLR